jgi:DNA modification methylase
MHAVYKQMKLPERREKHQTVGQFVDRACRETGVSRQSIYNYIERSVALVDALGPILLKAMLSGGQTIANDENILIKLAKLPAGQAARVVAVYMRGAKGEAAAGRLVESYLNKHRLSGLKPPHEPRPRAGSLSQTAGEDGTTPAARADRNVVYFGDAHVHLQETMRADSAQTCVTSPPFYAQRDFGTRHWFGGEPDCKHDRRVTHAPFHAGHLARTKYRTPAASVSGQTATTHACSKCGAWYGQLGQEPDVGTFIDHMVAIFRGVRRVLRPDGVCWVEIGDTMVEKGLLLVPQRLALALQEDGWIVRAEVILQKLTALPESVTDRPTRAHSTILMLTRNADYYYDPVAVLEPTTGGAKPSDSTAGIKESTPGSGNRANRSFHRSVGAVLSARNCRDVWAFVSGRFPDAHTATFPPALPERCIRASTSAHGACSRCGAPWYRRTHQPRVGANVRRDGSVMPVEDKEPGARYVRHRMRAARLGKSRNALPARETIGWEPTCTCGVAEVVPCVVLDPFAGSGTTLMVAKQLARDYVGIEINEQEYGPLISKRLRSVGVEPAESRPSRARRLRR